MTNMPYPKLLPLLALLTLPACAMTKLPAIRYDDPLPVAAVLQQDEPVEGMAAETSSAAASPIAELLPAAAPSLDLLPRATLDEAKPSAATPPPARVSRATAEARVEPEQTSFVNARQVYAYNEGALYQVYTAIGHITELVLEPGETLAGAGPVAAGDTLRWIIADTSSGAGESARVHILIKPTRAGLITNLIINTNKRTYHVEARSLVKTYMPSVAWTYPQDALLALKTRQVQRREDAPIAANIDLTQLKFRYAISGDDAPWKPLRAFDDGRQVFIEFPAGIAQGELPPLFVIGPEGEGQLVNYRVRRAYMIVDRLFAAAELRLGGDKTQRVRIERTDGGAR
jgi:type IV secretion system protein TrbG